MTLTIFLNKFAYSLVEWGDITRSAINSHYQLPKNSEVDASYFETLAGNTYRITVETCTDPGMARGRTRPYNRKTKFHKQGPQVKDKFFNGVSRAEKKITGPSCLFFFSSALRKVNKKF